MRSHGPGLRYATAERSLDPCNLRNAWADMYHIHEARSRVAGEDVEKGKKITLRAYKKYSCPNALD